MSPPLTAGALRRQFFGLLLHGLKVVWPILLLLIGTMVGLGLLVARLEGWPWLDGVYFAFVSGLTIGYGDLAPKGGLARVLAITIGFTGILLGGLIAAVGVQALQSTAQAQRNR
jgi:ABC-type branched-subunit amino acid transport system substrate-binding protein